MQQQMTNTQTFIKKKNQVTSKNPPFVYFCLKLSSLIDDSGLQLLSFLLYFMCEVATQESLSLGAKYAF